VLNFLNRKNAADARLYELLEKKLNLFDGVFGASDEILGALDTGVDFEKRVLEIYQSCRSPEEINAAFDELRSDLGRRIDRQMTQTRSLLLERFDADVRRRLRIRGERAQSVVSRRKRSTRELALALGCPELEDPKRLVQLVGDMRRRPPEPVSYLRLDARSLPARLLKHAGSQGWWFAYRVETTGLWPEERLLHLVLLRSETGFFALPMESVAAWRALPAEVESRRRAPACSVAVEQERALQTAREELLRISQRRTDAAFDAAKERQDRHTEECLLQAREALDEARAAWEDARTQVLLLAEGPERAKGRAQVNKLERDYRRKLSSLRAEEDARYAAKDKSLAALTQRAKVTEQRTLVASAYFWLE
jgi:hypothetical protein